MNTALSTESVGALESAYYALLAERDALRGQLLEERRTAAAELRDLDEYWIDKMSGAQAERDALREALNGLSLNAIVGASIVGVLSEHDKRVYGSEHSQGLAQAFRAALAKVAL